MTAVLGTTNKVFTLNGNHLKLPFVSGVTIFTGGTTYFKIPMGTTKLEWLVIGGGGQGGCSQVSYCGGGGGAGGFYTGVTYNPNTTKPYRVTVGNGAVKGTNGGVHTTGGTSILSGASVVVFGLGGGWGCGRDTAAGNGASGGGSNVQYIGGYGLGNPIGNNGALSKALQGGGGGGGAGGVGTRKGSIPFDGCCGGIGRSSTISGTLKTYCVGGAGGTLAPNNYDGTDGAPNTGNGGRGGGTNGGTFVTGGAGGSGIIILKYT
jgi:MSHA biogenesis protein MshQ